MTNSSRRYRPEHFYYNLELQRYLSVSSLSVILHTVYRGIIIRKKNDSYVTQNCVYFLVINLFDLFKNIKLMDVNYLYIHACQSTFSLVRLN